MPVHVPSGKLRTNCAGKKNVRPSARPGWIGRHPPASQNAEVENARPPPQELVGKNGGLPLNPRVWHFILGTKELKRTS